jgi:hypothetical protein
MEWFRVSSLPKKPLSCYTLYVESLRILETHCGTAQQTNMLDNSMQGHTVPLATDSELMQHTSRLCKTRKIKERIKDSFHSGSINLYKAHC